MLGMLILMPNICFSRDRTRDSLMITRIWQYRDMKAGDTSGAQQNVYLVSQLQTKRRNPLLYLVPSMYSIARGQRNFVSESYFKVKYLDNEHVDVNRQVICGTIPHNREALPILYELMKPDIYGVQLYEDRLLSPFHRSNRFFYKYSVVYVGGPYATVFFRPRNANTQLIKGSALVDANTGYVSMMKFTGEFDMLRFHVDIYMQPQELMSTLPERCTINAAFRFVGNQVDASFTSYYGCQETLPDSIHDVENRELMEKLRPCALTPEAESIYREFDKENDNDATDSVPRKKNKLKEIAWDVIGNNMVNSMNAKKGAFSFNVSPLFNPFYMSYSNSRGIAYRLHFGVQYNWNSHRYLSFEPMLGYNTKKRQFYYTLPLRMTYNPKRNGYAEIKFGNGERMSNDILGEAFKQNYGNNTVSMPEFKDRYLQVVNNVAAFDWLELTTGIIYHRRNSLDSRLMQKAKLPDTYRSFSTTMSLHFKPWMRGPVLTANWEHSFKGVLNSDLEYDRWEYDAVYKHNTKGVQVFNMRLGAGFYAKRNTQYFVDYSNFRDNNLPTGWEDDWSGQFQLVPSGWYNRSRYYLRGHISYDSPLLALAWVPLVGQFVESERIYISALSIQDIRPYFELGYGFKNRLFSTAFFASFLNMQHQDFGIKFTFELFRRW